MSKPTLSGCTFIRNGSTLGFPFVESILSIIDIVDEFVITVGKGSDDTLDQIKSIKSSKIKIIETTWNEKMSQRGFVYAQQKMISQYACTSDWVFYLEGDEIVHEKDHAAIQNALNQNHNKPEIEALVFDYHHFYGSPEWLAVSPRWYRRECRIIRNTIRSFAPDGQYWVVMSKNRKGRYPVSALANAHIYHYGHVRQIEKMQLKAEQVSKYWDQPAPQMTYENVDPHSLRPFKGSHPKAILNWLNENAEKKYDPPELNFSNLSLRDKKHRISMFFEKALHIDLSKKHYKLAID